MRDDGPAVTAELLLNAYAAGVFPMAESADGEIQWIDPRRRGIIPLGDLHVSRSLKRRIRRGGFEVRVDTAFADVVAACADRDETWINAEIFDLYAQLHEMGFAHSVEIWVDGALSGGLYGVRLGGAFFGESMYSRVPDASKLALVWLVARLRAGGFALLDTQFITDHLETMGGVEISRAAYHARLGRALMLPAQWDALPGEADVERILAVATG